MNKLCLIIPYYGEMPWWIKYFLRSVDENSEYNWLLVSTKKPENKLPSNLKFLELPFSSLSKLISEKFDIDAGLTHPYKICDFKPAFGKIFEDYLKKFKYWGYCDLDLVFGQLCNFLEAPMAGNIDVISPEVDFYPGHFCVFRNTPAINNLFTQAKNYKEVFASEKCFLFDEFCFKGGIDLNNADLEKVAFNKIERHKKLIRIKTSKLYKLVRPLIKNGLFGNFWSQHRQNDFNSILRKAESLKTIRVFKKAMNESDVNLYCSDKRSWNIRWKEGQLYSEPEILYFHFQMAKNNPNFVITENKNGFELILK